ncbi:MAG: tyrosine-type recombinase/integrase [Bacillus sp. (in: Bacteria)]|nr:tyrosine-type recombinase/integrase [Bacillus sp. (in: firmicutes)]MCM1425568.1 tyrosine-type recombinase/integrase [Eubacterium sp.]
MSTTYPIKDQQALEDFKNYYASVKINFRNYALIITGLNTAARISDLLQLQWKDVYMKEEQTFRKHIFMREQKTGKERAVAINPIVRETLYTLLKNCTAFNNEDYLFPSAKNKSHPISRYQAYRIIREAAENTGLQEHISCHSLRKTFGYHAWKQGASPAVLMDIYNHSSYTITKRYLCIEQDDRDKVYMNIKL